MKYEIGDKVKLKNGSILIITDIISNLDNTQLYAHKNIPILEEDILKKIEE